MSTVAPIEPRIMKIQVTDDTFTVVLTDGRTVTVPLAWSWRLSEAEPSQHQRFEIIGDGLGVRWPELDEDLGAQGMLIGVPARRRHPPSAAIAS